MTWPLAFVVSVSTLFVGWTAASPPVETASQNVVPKNVVPQNGTKLGEPVALSLEPTRETEQPSSMLRLPDGRFVPPLNDVKRPQPMQWKHGEFTRIVARERTHWRGIGEIDWYVHEDGTRSTTLLTNVDGRKQPVTLVLHAMPAGWTAEPGSTVLVGATGSAGHERR